MCGITGVLSLDPDRMHVDEALLVRMRDTMRHRGPDGEGVWVANDRSVGLAHRRLSIIELSDTAAQPMLTRDGRFVLTFNGEIYNHAEIRRELEADGVRDWRSDHSDTEVLLRSFERWGVDCVHRFRGMFAFGVWDDRERELWLVRDRIGIKPLYYSIHHGRLAFASEIKALAADPAFVASVDEEALYHYLSFLTTPAPATLFAGVRKLPPGTWLRVRPDGSVRQQRYWDVWDEVDPLRDVSEDEIAERVLEELRVAVSYRKVGDVPIGVFLSGGIDSSTNTALFSEGEQSPVKTFSIGYEGEFESYKNELDYARMMANVVGADHHERLLTLDDLLDFLPEMVRLQDEPIGDPVCVPVYYVADLARRNGVTVCQVGEGADELFWGYPGWKSMLRLQHLADRTGPPALKRPVLPLLRAAGKGNGFRYEYARRAATGTPVFWSGAEAFTEGEKNHLLSARMRRDLDGLTSWAALEPAYRRFRERAWDPSPLNWMSYTDLSLRLPELLLMRVDKMTMAVSLEARVPFLDHRFVGLAMSIPEAVKTRNGTLKHVLKKAVRGVIPDELIDRPKQGFGVPVIEYFYDRLGDVARHELRLLAKETDFFDPAGIEALLARRNGPQIWYLLNFALWLKTYVA